jgi:integron integrase
MAEASIHRAESETSPATLAPVRAPKLLDRVRDLIRAKHYSRRTESAYVDWIRRYIVFHRKRHPSDMGAPEIAAFLTWLATERRVSAATQNQALSALLFLYRDILRIEIGPIEHVPRARMPVRVAVALSHDEVARIMKQLDGVAWIIVALLYGAGLRLQECLELRVKDVDFERRQIVIRRGKGQKDRPTILPTAVIEPLSRHLEGVKRQHQADLARGFGRVVLPFALDRKYSNAATEWAWQFVFPASRVCTDPRWGPPTLSTFTNRLSRRRWRTRHGRPASPNVWVDTPSGIRLRLTCSRTAMTVGRCRSCWGTRMSARRWCTRTCSIAVLSACAVPSIASERRRPIPLAARPSGQPLPRVLARRCEVVDPQWVDCCRPRS